MIRTIRRRLVQAVVTSDERRRLFEIVAAIGVSVLLYLLSRLEGNLLTLSQELSAYRDYFTTVVYFGLVNLNVLLILVLAFLIFRNLAKHILERRRGVIGTKLRSKLILALIFFALAPTALLFYVSTRFLSDSFETWFSLQIKEVIYKTQQTGAKIYERDKLRVESLARVAEAKLVDAPALGLSSQTVALPLDVAGRLRSFSAKYALDGVMVYDQAGKLLWTDTYDAVGKAHQPVHDDFVRRSLERFRRFPNLKSRGVETVEDGRDVVKGAAAIRGQTAQVIGLVVTVQKLETQIISSLESILNRFIDLKPGAELIKLSYVIILVLIVVLILFSAVWLGFYVAKGLVAPIQNLAAATRKVALGHYDVKLDVHSDDETGTLIKSFNRMTSDLKIQQDKVREFTEQLEQTNDELESWRKNIEVMLKNISAGVISVDGDAKVTTINAAAYRLLRLAGPAEEGDAITKVMAGGLLQQFWQPIYEKTRKDGSFMGQLEIGPSEDLAQIYANGSKIFGDSGEELGVVVVFDDASEQVKVQRMMAWREVARRIAHEVKNPMTPIKLSAERLLRRFGGKFDDDGNQVFEQCIATIVTEVDALRDLVNQFSKFAKMPTVTLKPENAVEVVSEVAHLFQDGYPAIDVTLTVEGGEANLPQIKLDREQLKRALINLLTNSVQAFEQCADHPGPKIALTMATLDGRVLVIKVTDNGPGIPDEIRNRVTEPYFSTKKEGTGLGLAIVHQIISDHGGYLKVHRSAAAATSRWPGTEVTIEIPL